jgi:predicted RNase H-like nuclease (RuvC/YqgF family)
MLSETVTIALISGMAGAIPAILGTWGVMREDAAKRRKESHDAATTAAKRVEEDFRDLRQRELEALEKRQQALTERERWYHAEALRMIDDSRERIETLERATTKQAADLHILERTNTELRQEIELLSNVLTQMRHQNEQLKRENARIPQLERRIAELERITHASEGS